jgi:rSAM/selenodomain-associated transferase 1
VSAVALVVIAKAPGPGRSKTRLCPPCSPDQAAELAGAALADTLAAVAATPARLRLLALDGQLDEPAPPGVEVIPQAGDGLGERLGHALVAAGGPALVVGMDTPQLTPYLLAQAAVPLTHPGVDAVVGPALDGGYWTIGMRSPDSAAFEGVPMSSSETGAAQVRRLRALGLRVAALAPQRDVDTIADARAVARAFPRTAFARTLLAQGLA